MSFVPTQSASGSGRTGSGQLALHGAVEQLFSVTDAAGVVDVCERLLASLGITGRLGWRLHGTAGRPTQACAKSTWPAIRKGCAR